jgi:hypothetical protein
MLREGIQYSKHLRLFSPTRSIYYIAQDTSPYK